MFLILSQLDFGSLLNAAETNQQLFLATADLFQRKYSKRQIVITNNFELSFESASEPLNLAGFKIYSDLFSKPLEWLGLVRKDETTTVRTTHIESDLSIEINDYKMMMNTFKYFGHTISNLKYMVEPFNYMQTKLLGELIGNYGSKSLVEVRFDNCLAHTLESITKPLVNAKIVTFARNRLDYKNKTFPMHIFPAVQCLMKDCTRTSAISIVLCHIWSTC